MISRCAQCCNVLLVRKNNVFFFFSYHYSGYGSQAVSSNTLSSDDSMSLRSISVDDTPDTEIGPSKIGAEELKKVASSVAVDLTKAAAASNTMKAATADASNQSSSSADLLSPPDISLTSISPGDETDATVTITPSSATITPSQSSEMGKAGSREKFTYRRTHALE